MTVYVLLICSGIIFAMFAPSFMAADLSRKADDIRRWSVSDEPAPMVASIEAYRETPFIDIPCGHLRLIEHAFSGPISHVAGGCANIAEFVARRLQ